jgi:hypothetical protein
MYDMKYKKQDLRKKSFSDKQVARCIFHKKMEAINEAVGEVQEGGSNDDGVGYAKQFKPCRASHLMLASYEECVSF